MTTVDHIAGQTWHGRRGDTKNAFRYSVDYVLCDAEARVRAPALFTRNGRNVAALNDADHGGTPGQGRGSAWVREVMAAHGIALTGRIDLLAQPRMWGHVFNPVAFWLCHDDAGVLRLVIAEVTNTYGDRHSYLCHHDDLSPITPDRDLTARKIMHVSPFQPVEGGYTFRFDITDRKISIRIDFSTGQNGLVATLTGDRKPLTTAGLLAAALRRPLGSRRVLALIHWQALVLWWKGVPFRSRPEAPAHEVSR
jgi:DUF1365 family protein